MAERSGELGLCVGSGERKRAALPCARKAFWGEGSVV